MMDDGPKIDAEAIGRSFRELVEGPTPTWRESLSDATWRRGRRVFTRIINALKRMNPMSGPDKIPEGSWGGDLDPMTSQRRAQFEQSLSTQQQHLQQLHQQAAAGVPQRPPVQVIDSMPPPRQQDGGPGAGGMTIPAAGEEGGGGGDLIGAMGAGQERTEREMARARAASGEGPPVPEDVVPQPPGLAPRAMGHIPPSLRRQMVTEAAANPPPPPRVPLPATPMEQQPQPRQGALARKRAIGAPIDMGVLLLAINSARELVEGGSIHIEGVVELLSASAELQYAIALHLEGARP